MTVKALFNAGVDAVSGYQATARALENNTSPKATHNAPIHIAAIGKAADAMTRGALSILGDRLASGMVITKHHHLSETLKTDDRLACHECGHPIPDENSLKAGNELKHYVAAIPPQHTLLVLISGGASALVEDLQPGLDLAQLKTETEKLIASGATIGQINQHRRQLSQIKGGKLARHIHCPVLQLLISDVPGDKPGDIGSGLLVPDENTGMPDNLPVWQQIDTHLIATNDMARQAVCDAARSQGIQVQQANGSLHGDMRCVVERLKSVLTQQKPEPGLYVWGGEPTINLPENPGQGGRNQHLALAMAEPLSVAAKAHQQSIQLLVCGTDGTDGPTLDAGALVDHMLADKAINSKLNIQQHLDAADAGSCLKALDALVTTGPTGTNVMDLAIAYITPMQS